MRWFNARKRKKKPEVERATAAPGERRRVWVPKSVTNGSRRYV